MPKKTRVPGPAFAGLIFIFTIFAAVLGGCGTGGDPDAAEKARRLLDEGRYDEARSAAFNAAGDEKYELLKKIDARKEVAETQLSDIKFTVAHAYKEGRPKVQQKLETIKKETLDRKVKSEAETALAGLDKLFANEPKPQPIPANVPRPGVIESEPQRKIRVLDTKPPEDSLKKKTSMAPTARTKELIEVVLDDVNHWHYRQALELLAMAAAEMSEEEREYLKSVSDEEIKPAASQALAALVLEANSEIGDRQASFEKLYSKLNDFPATPEIQQLRESIETVLVRNGDATKITLSTDPADRKRVRTVPTNAPGEARGHFTNKRSLPSESGIDELFAQAQTANDAFDFSAACEIYKKAADQAKLDVLKNEAAARAGEMLRLASIVLSIDEAIHNNPANYKEFDPGTGRRGQLLSADGRGLRVDAGAGNESIGWNAISGAAWKSLVSKLGPLEPEQKISVAALLARAKLEKDADQLLKEAVDANSGLQATVDEILARRRGIETPSYGFVWFNNQWMTFKDRENHKLAEKIQGLLARIESAGSPREREMFSNELGKLGSEATDALGIALKAKKIDLTKKLHGTAIAKKMNALREERIALDRARQHALDLIFDENKYFYPYRAPECPPEKAKLYPAVQKDVSSRVAAVIEWWNSKTTVPLGAAQGPLRLLHEIDERMRALKIFDGSDDEETNLYLSIDPSITELTIRNICLSADERRFVRDYNHKIRVFNLSAKTDMNKEEIACAELTNNYREMMGRKILAYNNKLTHSSQKHSKWMSEVGELTHFSRLPGARTPFDRMKNEGYGKGVGENCAFTIGPDGAFLGWQHSSGHHRNMLMVGHTEFGLGAAGAYWTQNFGVDREYKTNEAWRE